MVDVKIRERREGERERGAIAGLNREESRHVKKDQRGAW